ncbi:MAG: TIGR00341 family protein [Hyphomonas sp.]|nr:TIGR00341 family protein [Hyphomonas sp.]
MSARLLEMTVPDTQVRRARECLETYCVRQWQESVPGGNEKFSGIVLSHNVEPLLRELNDALGQHESFSALVMALEAVSPPVVEPELMAAETATAGRPPSRLEQFLSRDRRSTDEIYDDVVQTIEISPHYVMTIVLSSVIAALGMRSGQTAIVIGAMIVAPLLGPSLTLAMAGTVGNGTLAHRALKVLGAGILVVYASTLPLGLFVEFDPLQPELHNRTIIQPADIALALASGAAGVLALAKGESTSLVGVMVAVSLVPPLSASGMYLGDGHFELAVRSATLFLTNLVCINVAGILTFLISGLPPRRWRITTGILAVWIALLVLLGGVITGHILIFE